MKKWWGILACLALLVFIWLKWGDTLGERISAPEVEQKSRFKGSRASERDLREISGKTFAGFPLERIEAVYAKYPILAFNEDLFSKREKSAFEKVLESIEDDFDVPTDLRKMLRKRGVWNSDQVEIFLDEHTHLIQSLMQLHQLSPQRGRFSEELLTNPIMRVLGVKKASALLRLKMHYHLQLGESDEWLMTRDALRALARHTSKHALTPVGAMVAGSVESSPYDGWGRLASPPELPEAMPYVEMLSDAYRAEFVLVMSVIDKAKRGEGEKNDEWESLGISEDYQRFLEQNSQTKLELMFGEVSATLIKKLNATSTAERLLSYKEALDLANDVLSHAELQNPEIGRDILGGFVMQVEWLTMQHLARDHYLAVRALRLASQDGVVVEQLSELVPRYLSEVPLNRETQEPFYFNADKNTVEVPTDLRDWELRAARHEKVDAEAGSFVRDVLREIGLGSRPNE